MNEDEDYPCEWCGWPFPPESREGAERADCMNRIHEQAVCNNCGGCLHYDHSRPMEGYA